MTAPAAMPAKPFHVGEMVCYPIPDGDFVYPRAAALPPEMEPAAMEAFPATFVVPYTPLLVVSGDLRILLDTGAGPLAPTTGRLRASLNRAGYQPDEIDLVVLSHGHPDHIGGLLAEDGAPVFPQARLLMSHSEYDLWHSGEMRNRLGTGAVYGSPHIEDLMRDWVDRYLTPLGDRMEWVEPGCELVPGIALFPARGHTPDHFGVAISSGADSLLYTADAFTMPEQIAHPEWTSAFDLDRPLTVVTRKRLLDRAATERSRVYHYHFSQVGAVVRHGTGFAWEHQESLGKCH